MSALSDWNDIIRRMGDERRRADDEQLAAMRKDFPAAVAKLREMPHAALLSHFQAYSQRSCSDPRHTQVYSDLATEAEKELLDRLNAPHLIGPNT